MINLTTTFKETDINNYTSISVINTFTVSTVTNKLVTQLLVNASSSETLTPTNIDIIFIYSDNPIKLTIDSVVMGSGKLFIISKDNMASVKIENESSTLLANVNVLGVNK